MCCTGHATGRGSRYLTHSLRWSPIVHSTVVYNCLPGLPFSLFCSSCCNLLCYAMLVTTKVQLYLLVGHSAVHSVTKGQKGGQPDDNVQSAMYWFWSEAWSVW